MLQQDILYNGLQMVDTDPNGQGNVSDLLNVWKPQHRWRAPTSILSVSIPLSLSEEQHNYYWNFITSEGPNNTEGIIQNFRIKFPNFDKFFLYINVSLTFHYSCNTKPKVLTCVPHILYPYVGWSDKKQPLNRYE